MTSHCQMCGGLVRTAFEHIDIDCRPIGDAPRDGTVITGLYEGDVRRAIKWQDHRPHPGGGNSCGPGWVDEENGFPDDEPEAWASLEEP